MNLKEEYIEQMSEKAVLYHAIKDGVEAAMWRMITNATDMPCSDFFVTIKQGVANAIHTNTPSKD